MIKETQKLTISKQKLQEVGTLDIEISKSRNLPASYGHDNELLEYDLKFVIMAYESNSSLRKSYVNLPNIGSSSQVAALEIENARDRTLPESYHHDNELNVYELKFIIMAWVK